MIPWRLKESIVSLISMKNVCQKYKGNDFFSLKNIDLEISKGEILGLIGPNGAGKTTLIKILSGLLVPTSYDELKLLKKNDKKNTRVGLILNSNQLYDELTVLENIKFSLSLFKQKRTMDEIDSMLKLVDLYDRKSKLVRTLSTGMKQKLNIIKTMMLNVELLILDEPTSGLDPISKVEINNLLSELSQKFKVTVIISSHVMNEVERLCSRVVFLNKGMIIENCSMGDLFDKFGKKIYEIHFPCEDGKLKPFTENMNPEDYIVFHQNNSTVMMIFHELSDFKKFSSNDFIESFQERRIQLEDIFFYYIYKNKESVV
ncbi:ABC transporter ATP-binding protein [Acidilutibacter cellobiosedens]|jgi:ABC-2 type transport system ATP-binding protein|uniref:ABC transporter ATP-binding protein n=2 Tax=Acidilutibacter cellobiosedens TaxID=2507161 RepID=A0A410QGH8_9FIRM|nr:ABC transporter ATP-binding protein [Tissierellaceae bacterium]QAT63107.1 ABC transporter ATP-binding protein [Acidilutibacter cellobiosedens]SCL86047.1 putative ABC transporter ATP-binding protein YxlF [Sporanaerobacter sp. PP17-6a]